jgi:hypothetical protein
LIDTIAMIGSPAARGATASVAGAGRAGLATASALSAAMVASANIAGGAQRRIAEVDSAAANRFAMLIPIECVPVPA